MGKERFNVRRIERLSKSKRQVGHVDNLNQFFDK